MIFMIFMMLRKPRKSRLFHSVFPSPPGAPQAISEALIIGRHEQRHAGVGSGVVQVDDQILADGHPMRLGYPLEIMLDVAVRYRIFLWLNHHLWRNSSFDY